MHTTSVLMLLVTGLRAVAAAACDNGGTLDTGSNVCTGCPTGTTAGAGPPPNCFCPATQGYDAAATGNCRACLATETLNTVSGRCECNPGNGLNADGECVDCAADGFTIVAGECTCPTGNGIRTDGSCGPCPTGEAADADGNCACLPPNGDLDGVCTTCTTSGRELNTQTGACDCVAPKGITGTGACATCTDGSQVLDAATGNCVAECPEGFEPVSGVCELECAAGEVRNAEGACVPNTSTTSPTSSPTDTATTAPETTPESTPAETTPAESTPAESTPAESTPAETTPAESTPAESTPATTGTDSSASGSTTATTSTPAPTSTDGPLPAQIGDFSFVGCAGSDTSFPTFTLQFTNAQMTLDLCTAACNQHLYAGIFQTSCYCADSFEEAATVSPGSCDIPCAGNPAQNCGGLRQFVKRQNVPSNALLVVYINDPVALTATVPTSVATTTLSATTTATETAVTTETAYPCLSGYCHRAGWVFELCNGLPFAGELVWILSPCSCLGGWQYIQANCDGASCAGLTVYRVVPYTGAANQTGLTVYQPAPCTTGCSGEVVFTQPSGGSSTGGSTGGGSASPSAPVVVTAGASKVAGSLMGLLGVFAMLM